MIEEVFIPSSALERLSVSDKTRQLQQLLLGSDNIFADNDLVQHDLRNIVRLDTADRDVLGSVLPYARLEICLQQVSISFVGMDGVVRTLSIITSEQTSSWSANSESVSRCLCGDSTTLDLRPILIQDMGAEERGTRQRQYATYQTCDTRDGGGVGVFTLAEAGMGRRTMDPDLARDKERATRPRRT